jgi:hypothetical protein
MEAQKFIVVFAIGTYPEPDAFSSQRCHTSLRFMLMSLSNRCIGLSPGLFPSAFVIRDLYTFPSSFVLDMYLPNISLILLVTQTIQQQRNFNFLSITYDTECALFVTKLGRVATEISVKNCKNHFICVFSSIILCCSCVSITHGRAHHIVLI